jgi:hypothetical protein
MPDTEACRQRAGSCILKSGDDWNVIEHSIAKSQLLTREAHLMMNLHR